MVAGHVYIGATTSAALVQHLSLFDSSWPTMGIRHHFSGVFLLLVLSVIGVLLVCVPGYLSQQYETASQLGDTWVYVYFAAVGIGTALIAAVAVMILWRLWANSLRKRRRKERRNRNPSQLSVSDQEREIRENLSEVADLRDDPAVSADLDRELDPLVRQVVEKSQTRTLEIVAFGTVSSGKSSLLNALAGRDIFVTDPRGGTTLCRNELPWPGVDRVTLVDTPGLGEVDGEIRESLAAEAARNADVALVVVDGPLRDSECRLLEILGKMEKRIIVCLNKEDWYDEQEKGTLVRQITNQVRSYVHTPDVVAVRSRPTQRSRIRVLADGREAREIVELSPDIEPLAERMMHIVDSEGQNLLLANLLLQSRGLVEEARQRVKQSLDHRAWQIVDRHMWSTGGAAALSPLPTVDLVAGCAISTKMVLELARVYRHQVDQDTAMRWLAELGKHLLGLLGGVVATAFVGSLLKTVPGASWVVGGLLQGVCQALITRWIGAVFTEYFGNEMREPEGGLAGLAQRQWAQVTSVNELRKLIKSARARLLGGGDD